MESHRATVSVRRKRPVWPFVLVSLLSFVGASSSSANASDQQRPEGAPESTEGPVNPETMPRPVARAIRTNDSIVIDGRLSERAWEDAQPITTFVQSQPHAGQPATDPTHVRILYDSRHLYFGVFCYDDDSSRRVITSLEWDYANASTRDFDVFAIALDTFLDRQNAFMIHVNPVGAIRDAQVTDDSRNQNIAWRGVWQVRTQITDQGWTAEIAIPWTTLRFDPTLEEQVWGMNILRRVRSKNEDSYWAPVDRRDPVHRMSRAGTLVGIQGIRPGRNFAVKPYFLAAARPEPRTGSERGSLVDGGADIKYSPTSQLTVDLTVRTDFAQADVDRQQVNLTRFSLFFPEQRDFFLENSGAFTFGDVTERESRMGASLSDFSMFHSRRIGLAEDGSPVPILAGGRLTGRAASFELGLLNMQTRSEANTPAENFSVARVRRRIFKASDFGIIMTNRQVTDDAENVVRRFNRAYGADLSLRLLGSLLVHSYVAATESEADDEQNKAARVAAVWRDRLWDISGLIKYLGEGFDPGIGFVSRRGMRQNFLTIGAHPRPKRLPVQELNPYVEIDYITRPGATLETRTGTAGLGIEFRDGSTVTIQGNDRFEHLEQSFRVQGSATVLPGDYEFREGSVGYQSSRGRSLSMSAGASGGGYYDGNRASVRFGGLWRPHYRLSLDFSLNHNRIDLPGVRAFTADVVGVRVRYGQSTRLFGSGFVQYNTSASQLFTNLRMNFVHAPSSDLFVVYNERREMKIAGLTDRALIIKVTKLFAF
jgi:hypothetical protein